MFVRLITLVDDYGRFEAHPTLLRSMVFPLNPDITCEQMLAACQQMLSAGMVVFYECEGVRYLQITRWQERARAKSRFPDPSDNKCSQLANICAQTADKCSPPSTSTLAIDISHKPAAAPSASGSAEEAQGRAAPAPPASRFPTPTLEQWLEGVIPDDAISQWSRDYWERKFYSAGQRQWRDWKEQEIRDWRAYRNSLAVTFRNEHAEKLAALPRPADPDFAEKRRAEQAQEEARQASELLAELQTQRE